ncbi:MAG: hypothetical protein SGJ24_09205 [Chloroflexota bacterium]|nr:hypothetical protein [Chloroflexota bacterium]
MDTAANSAFEPQDIVEAYPGLFQEWYADRKMVAYRLTNVSQALIDAWAGLVITTLQEWDKATPYLAMHDLSAAGVSTIYASLTSYDMLNIGITLEGKVRAETMLNQNPGLIARVAIAFNITLSGHIGKTLVNYYTDKHPAVLYKSYYSRDKSLRWLTTFLDQQGAPTGATTS